MKNLILSLSCLASVSVFAQNQQLKPLTSNKPVAKLDTVFTVLDINNPSLKRMVVTFNALPREQGNLVKGAKEGIWKTYYDNGSPKTIQEYHNGKLNGTSMNFDRSSFIMSDENYLNGLLEGLAIQYHNGGKIKSQAYYKKGILNGMKYINYDDGTRQEESTWVNGKKNGLTKWFYQGGKLAGEYNYKDDKINGEAILYSNSGSKIKEGIFINGLEDGLWMEYNETTAELLKKVTYSAGKIIKEELTTPAPSAEQK